MYKLKDEFSCARSQASGLGPQGRFVVPYVTACTQWRFPFVLLCPSHYPSHNVTFVTMSWRMSIAIHCAKATANNVIGRTTIH